jgi:catechol 2,3-dioxygenase-like lactoylglutathione lyase family enzyme
VSWRIDHIGVRANDVRESAAFYREVLGMQEQEFPAVPKADFVKYDLREDTIAYFPEEGGDGRTGLHIALATPEQLKDHDWHVHPLINGHFALEVDDLDEIRRRLEERGIPYTDIGVTALRGRHMIYVYDPAMNVVEIHQRV